MVERYGHLRGSQQLIVRRNLERKMSVGEFLSFIECLSFTVQLTCKPIGAKIGSLGARNDRRKDIGKGAVEALEKVCSQS